MTEMAHAKFNLVYDGPALREHRMEVRDLAPALLAMGELVERANEILNGNQAKVCVNVHASFKQGSFGIDLDLAQTLWQRVLDIANSESVTNIKQVVELLGLVTGTYYLGHKSTQGLIQVVRWLRGRSIQKIEPIGDGNVRLWVSDEHLDIEEKVLRLLEDYRIRRELENLIARPLAREGIESFATVDKEAKIVFAHVDGRESHYFFAPPVREETLQEDTYTANLQVLNLAFKGDNKWRFTEGGSAFYANVLDNDFLTRVATNQEQFAKDDLLRAKVRRTQRMTTSGLVSEYEIIQVLEHRSASPKVQLNLDLPNTPPKDGRD
ncbi:hypothetical protein [Arenimonas alkanexedens]